MLVARSCARVGGKDVVGEVKGVEVMGVLIVGEGESCQCSGFYQLR